MIYQFFEPGRPRFHDKDFYDPRPVSDHIHEEGHRERLLRTLADINFLLMLDDKVDSLSDLGCGNGGLLHELKAQYPYTGLRTWGYDLSPKAVEDGRSRYGVNIEHRDFVNDTHIETGDIVVLTETLEHLVDPVALLTRLRGKSRWVVASCPAFENEKQHYEFHLWAWEPVSFLHMFNKLGYEVLCHYIIPRLGTQFLIGGNP